MLERAPNQGRPDLRHERPAAIADDGIIDRAELVAFIRRHSLAIVACMGLGIVAAGLFVASQEPTYTAYTQIDDLKAPTLLDTQGREVETSLDTAEVESQMTVLRSEMIATMVIDELGSGRRSRVPRPEVSAAADAGQQGRGPRARYPVFQAGGGRRLAGADLGGRSDWQRGGRRRGG